MGDHGGCFPALALAAMLAPGLAAASTVLGVRETRFTLNGQPTFLLGISYYGGLGAPEEFARQDLGDLQRLGFHWLRVFATFPLFEGDVSAVDAQGQPREPFLGRLKWLVAECDRRGLVVDVTLTRGQGAGSVADLAAHRRAVETLVNGLRDHRNWYLDLANERDIRDDRFVSLEELKTLRELVRRLDPRRLVTASLGGHELSEGDARDALRTVGLDFVTPHRPRHAASPAETVGQAREALAVVKALGRLAPLHYQEPFRRGDGDWEPVAADFLTDLRGAVDGGAAGWCLHNGSQREAADGQPRRSFDLRTRRLFDQLDEEERAVTQQARFVVNGLPRLRVSGDGRFLEQEDGAPFFWLGDTAWCLRKLSREDIDLYMSHRRRHGFNVILVYCGYNLDTWISAADRAGNRPFLSDDTDTPNEAFWRNMDGIVKQAAEHGLYIGLVPMWGGEFKDAFGVDAAKARRLGRWLGDRYKARSHVLWVASGEYTAINDYRVPITAEQRSLFIGFGRGLRDGHGGAQLTTIHPGATRSSSVDFHGEAWLDFNVLQSGHHIDLEAYEGREVHALVAKDYALTPAKPVLDGEPIYEDVIDGVHAFQDMTRPRAEADVVRRKAYWSVFAGACGHTYGHNDIQVFQEGADKPAETSQRHHWREALDAPGALQMKHLRALMEALPFHKGRPDQSLVASDPGQGMSHLQSTRAADGSYALVYLPAGGTVTVDLERLAGPDARCSWFDPRTGGYTEIGAFPSRGRRAFTSPGEPGPGNDWVLVLRARGGVGRREVRGKGSLRPPNSGP